MKVYNRLLLAYIDIYHTIDYGLLQKEFHVTAREILGWAAWLFDNGYIVRNEKGFFLTEKGKKNRSESWIDYCYCADREESQLFQWDFLYIPQDFKE